MPKSGVKRMSEVEKKMTKEEAKNRIEELNRLTAYHAQKYYDEDSPEISDFEYDALMVELRNFPSTYSKLTDKPSIFVSTT